MKTLTPTLSHEVGEGDLVDFGIEILRCSPTPYSSPRKNLCGERQFCVNKGRILAQSKFLIRSPTRLTLMDFTRQKTLEYPFNCAVNMTQL